MSDHNYNQTILIGAAVAAGILGTLTGLLGMRRTNKGWTEQAKDFANQALEAGDMVNKKMVLGGVAGGIVGAAAALLLAPKSGAELIEDITRTLTHDERRRSGSHKSVAHKKKASLSTKNRPTRKATSRASEKIEHHASVAKKPSSRRRTAAAPPKATATHHHHEKETSETKET